MKNQECTIKINVRWLITGLALLILGYTLMAGGGSGSDEVFNRAIFNFQRLSLAPSLVLAGYFLVGISMFK